MKSLVSVIIPVYNASRYLAETLFSVVNQTYTNLEIIIVNDGSTDNSEEIIRDFQQKDARFHYYSRENQGQCVSSNFAIQVSNGDYIKFLDADDILSPEHIELQLKALGGNVNCLASCEWGRFYDDNYHSAKFIPEAVWKNMDSIDWIKVSLSQKSDMMGAWLWLIPKKILDIAGNWNEELSLNNDFDFSIRLLLTAKSVKFAEGAKLYYRSGLSASLSQTFSRKAVESAFLTTKLGCDNILKREKSSQIKKLCANRYQTWIFRIYPNYPDMIKTFEKEVKNLGNGDVKMDGGKVFIALRNMFGWKIARRIQLCFYKIGWMHIINLKKTI